jgi:hypothetical protein
VWLLLNAKDAPLVKKLSDINYELSEDEFGRILRFCAVSNEVQLELREHLKP